MVNVLSVISSGDRAKQSVQRRYMRKYCKRFGFHNTTAERRLVLSFEFLVKLSVLGTLLTLAHFSKSLPQSLQGLELQLYGLQDPAGRSSMVLEAPQVTKILDRV